MKELHLTHVSFVYYYYLLTVQGQSRSLTVVAEWPSVSVCILSSLLYFNACVSRLVSAPCLTTMSY